jgi:hypothetical protein
MPAENPELGLGNSPFRPRGWRNLCDRSRLGGLNGFDLERRRGQGECFSGFLLDRRAGSSKITTLGLNRTCIMLTLPRIFESFPHLHVAHFVFAPVANGQGFT